MFQDRQEAGRRLGERLKALAPASPVVFALPRGGLPVAAGVATALDAPLDLVLVRKLGVPMQPELALGAVVDGAAPMMIVNDDVVADLAISADVIAAVEADALAEIERRRRLYLGDGVATSATGRTAIVVDDGIATGATAEAALRALRQQEPARLVLAVPVAPADSVARLAAVADEVVCLEQPDPFWAVGAHYAEFGQLTDGDVARILRAHKQGGGDE